MTTTEARRVVTVERGSEWEDGFARPRVMLQPFAAPSILGLFGFAAAMFGGVAQFLAGMWAYRVRDAIATAMHGMWGAFWIAFGIFNLLVMVGKLPDHPAGSISDPAFAMWFWTLGAITAAGALAALAENLGLVSVLGTLSAGSILLAIGLSAGSVGWVKVAGWVLVASAILAYYVATSIMLLSSSGRVILPLGKLKKEANVPGGQPVKPIQLEWGEPGIKKGQ